MNSSNSKNNPSPPPFLNRLQNAYPDFKFKLNQPKFAFRPPHTILLGSLEDPNFAPLSLHELGHALLSHQNYKTDLERLKLELAAWEQAKKIAPNFGIEINQDLIEQELDTYRNWLHTKSKCKKCGLTRYETPDGVYHCPLCDH